jgi:hypothetical protein
MDSDKRCLGCWKLLQESLTKSEWRCISTVGMFLMLLAYRLQNPPANEKQGSVPVVQ